MNSIKLCLFVLLIGSFNTTYSQVGNYTFTQGISNHYIGESIYTNYIYQKKLSPPNSFVNQLNVIYAGSDTGTTAEYATGEGYPIGFNFIYHGESFDRVAVSGNGYIKLGHSGQPITIKNDSTAGAIFDGSSYNENILASFQTNANSVNPTYGSFPKIYMYGLPGNRSFVAEFSILTPSGTWINHQIQLEEKNNIIQLVYVNIYNSPNTYLQAAVGITSNNDFSNVKVVNGINTWTTAVRESIPTDLCDFNGSLMPPTTNGGVSAFMYTWTPPTSAPSIPTCPFVYFYVDTSYLGSAKVTYSGSGNTYSIFADSATNVLTNPVLNWSDVSVTSNQPTTYDVYLDISNPPLVSVAQNLATTSYTPSTLAPNTKYYYNIVPKNASGEDSVCVGSFTTTNLPQYCNIVLPGAGFNTFTLNTLSFVLSTTNMSTPEFPAIAPYTTTLKRDTSYTCSGTFGPSDPLNPWSRANIGVWIDFNHDGDFDDPGETITGGSAPPNGSFTFSVPIPDIALLGNTIMRIRSNNVANLEPFNACNTNYGAQDFIITIAPSTSCQTFTIGPVVANVNCYGQSNGSISLNAAGGAIPYTINWANGSTTDEITNLTKGIYQATVTDANSCEIATPLIPVLQPTALSIDTSRDSNNAIHVLVSGGTAPYNYLWSNDSTSSVSNNFTSGTYSVKVTDAHGCDTTMQGIVISAATVTPPPPPPADSITVTDSSININVYPNPNSGTIYLQSQKQQYLHIQIVSEQGKIMNDGNYTIGNGNATPVNIAAYPAGIYFLKIIGDKSTKVVKVIKVMK